MLLQSACKLNCGVTPDGLKHDQIVVLIKHTEIVLSDCCAGKAVKLSAELQAQLAFPTWHF